MKEMSKKAIGVNRNIYTSNKKAQFDIDYVVNTSLQRMWL